MSHSDPGGESVFRKIIENAYDAIVLSDTAGKIAEWNPSAERLFGIPKSAARGEFLWDLQFRALPDAPRNAQSCERVKALLLQFLHDGVAPQDALLSEVEIQRPDGTRLFVQTSAFSIRCDRGLQLCSVSRDITERRKAEELLRQSEQKFRLLLMNANDAVYVHEVSRAGGGRFIEVNDKACEMLGYTKDEFLSMSVAEIDTPEHTDKRVPSILDNLFAAKAAIFETQHLAKDGRRIPVEVSIRLFEFEGKPTVLSVARDITDRRRAQQQIKYQANLLANVSDAVIATDMQYTIRYWNTTAERQYGWKAHEVVGHPMAAFIVNDYLGGSLEAVLADIAQKGYWKGEVTQNRRDGTRISIFSTVSIVKDDSDQPIGFIAVNRDITERNRMEHELRRAQKLESLGLLAGGIAHDFNNLMGGVFGYIDLALTCSKDGAVSQYLSSAMGAIDRARGLTGQLLTFSKGGAPVRETGDLAPVVRDACTFALSGSNVSCAVTMPEDLWACNFDKNQISQVIGNIVINAQQAMPAGGTVTVCAANTSLKAGEKGSLQAGAYVKISIHDEGTGIAEHILPRIFDPFFTTKQKGSGLGLSICHSIVRRHDGWIDAQPRQGKGATFHIYLPALSKASPYPAPPKAVSVHRGSGRILIMDDEEVILRSLAKIIGSMGYSVECRREGKETLAILNEEIRAGRPFDAIILDLTVPGGMGGKEVAAEIRKMNLGIPVFVASGYSNDPAVAHPDRYGFTDSICKPFTIDELAAMFNRHVHAPRPK